MLLLVIQLLVPFQIIIWSLVSGHIFCRLKALPPDPTKPFDPLEGDAAVSTLVFLSARGVTRRAATLVACGPAGKRSICIHFYSGRVAISRPFYQHNQ